MVSGHGPRRSLMGHEQNAAKTFDSYLDKANLPRKSEIFTKSGISAGISGFRILKIAMIIIIIFRFRSVHSSVSAFHHCSSQV